MQNLYPVFKRFQARSLITTTLISFGYLLLCYLLIGFKTEQLYLVFLFNILFYFNSGTRKFILGFSIFIVFWVLFDFMKAFPNYKFNNVHIGDIYELDKHFFYIKEKAVSYSMNEFFSHHRSGFLDILSGIFYLCWMPVPLAFGIYLFYTKRPEYVHFALSFLLVNLVGFVIYYICPAAPPWYITLHGFAFQAHTAGNTTAALAHFDKVVGAGIFKGLYAQSSNVFAAMPSLHASYPTIVFFYAIRTRQSVILKGLFFLVMIGIWFAAVYTGHHYVLDVLAGICCAIFSLCLYLSLLKYSSRFNGWIHSYIRVLQSTN